MTTPNVSACAAWAQPADITEVANPTALPYQDTLAEALQAATDVLFQLSGRQYSGLCTDTVRPLPRILARDHGRPVAAQMTWMANGGWGYFSGAYLGGEYSRFGWVTTNTDELPDGTAIPEITLGAFPVVAVTEVMIDGQVLPQTDPVTGAQNWRVDDNRRLVRMSDPATNTNPGWPVLQRVDLPATEKDTWQVTFQYGIAPPTIGKLAAAELGYQLYLAVTPPQTGTCRLPARVTSITREGMSAVVLDPQVFLAEGRTGLTRCDYFIEAVNPGKLHRRSTVMSPDVGRRVRRTT